MWAEKIVEADQPLESELALWAEMAASDVEQSEPQGVCANLPYRKRKWSQDQALDMEGPIQPAPIEIIECIDSEDEWVTVDELHLPNVFEDFCILSANLEGKVKTLCDALAITLTGCVVALDGGSISLRFHLPSSSHAWKVGALRAIRAAKAARSAEIAFDAEFEVEAEVVCSIDSAGLLRGGAALTPASVAKAVAAAFAKRLKLLHQRLSLRRAASSDRFESHAVITVAESGKVFLFVCLKSQAQRIHKKRARGFLSEVARRRVDASAVTIDANGVVHEYGCLGSMQCAEWMPQEEYGNDEVCSIAADTLAADFELKSKMANSIDLGAGLMDGGATFSLGSAAKALAGAVARRLKLVHRKWSRCLSSAAPTKLGCQQCRTAPLALEDKVMYTVDLAALLQPVFDHSPTAAVQRLRIFHQRHSLCLGRAAASSEVCQNRAVRSADARSKVLLLFLSDKVERVHGKRALAAIELNSTRGVVTFDVSGVIQEGKQFVFSKIDLSHTSRLALEDKKVCSIDSAGLLHNAAALSPAIAAKAAAVAVARRLKLLHRKRMIRAAKGCQSHSVLNADASGKIFFVYYLTDKVVRTNRTQAQANYAHEAAEVVITLDMDGVVQDLHEKVFAMDSRGVLHVLLSSIA